CQLIRELL
ncbi:hypothetical protein CP99DC5_1157B, partial [Chlamydia psittaci 99DC5]